MLYDGNRPEKEADKLIHTHTLTLLYILQHTVTSTIVDLSLRLSLLFFYAASFFKLFDRAQIFNTWDGDWHLGADHLWKSHTFVTFFPVKLLQFWKLNREMSVTCTVQSSSAFTQDTLNMCSLSFDRRGPGAHFSGSKRSESVRFDVLPVETLSQQVACYNYRDWNHRTFSLT